MVDLISRMPSVRKMLGKCFGTKIRYIKIFTKNIVKVSNNCVAEVDPMTITEFGCNRKIDSPLQNKYLTTKSFTEQTWETKQMLSVNSIGVSETSLRNISETMKKYSPTVNAEIAPH